jgi:hypothetical protein
VLGLKRVLLLDRHPGKLPALPSELDVGYRPVVAELG